ncbi:Protease synthase and sporulation negative regulatory protein PAI 1 [compost metagenome]
MENIAIARASVKDVLQLQYISRATFLQTFSDINTEENMNKYLNESFATEQLDEELSNELSQFYFAKFSGEVIGYMKLNTGAAQKENPDENALEIERIYVLKDFHGKKVGQLLYNKAIEVANGLAVDHVWLGVWEENFRAIAFYTKNGFVKFGQHEFVLGDDVQTDLLMKLELNKEI